ncbi:Unknown protein sequence [Pseudomonas syringae pv. aceris]|nr:Unknown protein sequence [Pseudomonas syringae pv. aceris]
MFVQTWEACEQITDGVKRYAHPRFPTPGHEQFAACFIIVRQR